MWPFKVKKVNNTPAEELLDKIKDILFPPNVLREEVDPKSGQVFKFTVDYSIDMNLDAALIDIQEGNNDEIVQNTIKGVLKRLIEVRELLDVHMELGKESQFIVVEDPRESFNAEDINPGSDRSIS